MIRRPLRPIARVLKARESGVDPSLIEAEEKAARMQGQRNAERFRAQSRLILLAFAFLMSFGVVGWKMTVLATTPPVEPVTHGRSMQIVNQRANIVDRHGEILATNLATNSLFAHPQDMVDARAAADGLVAIFSDLDVNKLYTLFTGERKFVWIKHKLSPEQRQAVYDIGEPGLQFGPREIRLYPNGNLAAHILGGTTFGREGVRSAEVVGTAGVELQFDTFLRDCDLMGAQRHLKVIGIFARICHRDGKPKYLGDVARFFAYLRTVIARRPELADLEWILDQLEDNE